MIATSIPGEQFFLDTSFLLAVVIANDQFHALAEQHWSRYLRKHSAKLVSTTFVLNEVATYLNSRGMHQKAVEVGRKLLESNTIRLINIDDALLETGWRFFEKHHDKTYSLTDCISFVVMSQLGIRTAFTFDHHFRQAGFEIEPVS